MSALSEWTHVHCDNASSGEYIHDATLLKVISSSRSTGLPAGHSLLDAIDTSNLAKVMEDSGRIAFVFEKISKNDNEKPEEDAQE